MRLLFLGGTGVLSSACAARAVAKGHDLTMVTRGRSRVSPPPPGVTLAVADVTDGDQLRATLAQVAEGERFDAVVQFVGYEPGHIAEDVVTFAPRAKQYVLVSTAATYASFDRYVPLTEDTPQDAPLWEYAAKKIQCERVLREYADDADLPWTIVRPAHTYGPSKIPAYAGNSRHPWTVVARMRRGADAVVPGDGTSLWTLTHSRDFAVGLVGLLGNDGAYREAVHITGDEALTWDGIYGAIARASGLTDAQYKALRVHVPTDAMVASAPSAAGGLYGDKMHAAIYDTSKLRALVPDFQTTVSFEHGVRESIAWFEADPSRQTIDDDADRMLDRLGRIYRSALRDAAGVG